MHSIPAISIQKATLAYDNKVIFSDITMELPSEKWVGLIGRSGVGKSSLLKMIAGLKTTATIQGKITANNNIPVSQQIAYMAQTDLLLPWLSVLDNILLGTKLRTFSRRDYKSQVITAKTLLTEVGLSAASHLYPYQLSGGMRQRVALIRTLIENKPVILMDEPFSALDTITRYKLHELAADLLKRKTVLFITHDPLEALRLANNIYVMQGNANNIKQIACLNSKTPRQLTDPEVIQLQTVLFHELSCAVGDF